MRCLIIDDEASSRSRLRRLLVGYDDVQIVAEAENGMDGLQAIVEHLPDLVFLDIEMPALNGMQMLKAIPPDVPVPLVIFITGYDDHALEAFQADALAYLLKPIEEERLTAHIGRARKLLSDLVERQHEAQRLTDAMDRRPSRIDQIVGKKRDRFFLLRPEDVFFFTAEDGVVKAMSAKDSYLVDLTLNDLEKGLLSKRFFRAHRAALLNLNRIKEIQPYFRSSYMILMADAANTEFQVSERQAKNLRERIPGL